MKCNDKKTAELLPWYVNKTLSKDEGEKVKSHVSQCMKCKADLEKMKMLSVSLEKNYADLTSEHISPEQMVLYAEAKYELSNNDVIKIEQHLTACTDCKKEFQILEDVNRSIIPTKNIHLLERITQGFIDLFPKFISKPKLAYIIIILLLYPAWLGIFKLNNMKKKIMEPTVAQVNYELLQSGIRAEASEVIEIELSPQTDIFSLSFNVPILVSENIRYDAIIVDNQNKAVWQISDIKSLDRYGTFLLICHSKYFAEGNYILRISEFNSVENQVQNEFIFHFQITQLTH